MQTGCWGAKLGLTIAGRGQRFETIVSPDDPLCVQHMYQTLTYHYAESPASEHKYVDFE